MACGGSREACSGNISSVLAASYTALKRNAEYAILLSFTIDQFHAMMHIAHCPFYALQEICICRVQYGLVISARIGARVSLCSTVIARTLMTFEL